MIRRQLISIHDRYICDSPHCGTVMTSGEIGEITLNYFNINDDHEPEVDGDIKFKYHLCPKCIETINLLSKTLPWPMFMEYLFQLFPKYKWKEYHINMFNIEQQEIKTTTLKLIKAKGKKNDS